MALPGYTQQTARAKMLRSGSSLLLSKSSIPVLVVLVANAVSPSPGGNVCRSPYVLSKGLRNLGNTCYLNAQLQCAFHIPRVRQLVEVCRPEPSLAGEEESQPPSPALLALRGLFADMKENSRSVAPSFFCKTLGIPVMQQQDTQEFWKLLLPALKLSALTDLYQGAYEDYIVALDESGRERRREEAFLDLSLDVTSGSVKSSLHELFGEPERLSVADGNGWRPEKGADKVDAHKGTLLRSQGLSPILQLHLKRFQFDWATEKTSKLNLPFSFPELLDLSSVCVDSARDAKGTDDDRFIYDLQAVIVHVGEFDSGHYYSYIRPDVETDDWYRFNDDVLQKVELKDVLSDSYGGPLYLDGKKNEKKGAGILARIRSIFLTNGPSYGFGGATSNAYVLQYVRRSDIPMLYPGSE
jgi:ubiquitin carboxyl-terminal hydrolase 7